MTKLMLTHDHTFAPMSLIDAADQQGLMFETMTAPIVLPNGQETSFHYLYRELEDGTQVILNPHCDQNYGGGLAYRLDFAYIENIFPGTCVGLQAWNHGREVFSSHDLGVGHTFGDGDSLRQFMMYVGGLWGRKPVIASNYNRGFCENQLPSAEILLAAKRTKNHGVRMVEKSEQLQRAADTFRKDVQAIERRKLTTLSAAKVDEIFAEIVKMSANGQGELKQEKRIADREEALRGLFANEVAHFGRNAESLYQAVHTYEYHNADAHQKVDQLSSRSLLTLSEAVLRKVQPLLV